LAKKNNRGGSLQDQLRKVGLVSEKQLKKAQNHLHRKDVREKHGEVDEARVAAQQALEAKAQADRLRNEEKNRLAMERALMAQVRQLIETNSQREAGDVAYNFTHDNKVKTIHISAENKRQLNKGYLAIVALGDGYDIVPEPVARKIMDRRPEVLLYLYDRNKDVPDEDDPYKDFLIPDDLEW
ncbi:MAG: DUF2058 domain-containing protein, partial [Pseudomonadales bacterium]|nr:DUF2058 domain-containing protein [Pseudomonadales bacterium]